VGTATTYLIDGTPTNGTDPWIDSLVWGGAWRDGDGGTVTIQWTAVYGTINGQPSMNWSWAGVTALRAAPGRDDRAWRRHLPAKPTGTDA